MQSTTHSIRVIPTTRFVPAPAGRDRRQRGQPAAELVARRVARQVRLMLRRKDLFPVAGIILRCATHADRAAHLLRLPDDTIAAQAGQLREACTACGFDDGAGYVDVRSAVICATRDRDGRLPARLVAQLETWRAGMAALAGGGR